MDNASTSTRTRTNTAAFGLHDPIPPLLACMIAQLVGGTGGAGLLVVGC
jgi:hypothetical protein